MASTSIPYRSHTLMKKTTGGRTPINRRQLNRIVCAWEIAGEEVYKSMMDYINEGDDRK